MKNTKSLRLSGMLFLLFLIFNYNYAQAQAEDGLQVPKVAPAPVNRGYLQYLPSDYSSTTQNYPCIIFLHGSGQRGNGTTEINKVANEGTPKFIANGSTMCFTVNGATECFIVLSPQQNTSRWGWLGYEVMPFVNYALNNYRIDPNRVYLTGLSMGGDGTWDNSYASENAPNYFAAIAPVSCKGDYNMAKITAARKIPVWAFHGNADTSVPIADGKRPINGMNSVNANPAPIWTVISGGGHSGATWDMVYNPTLNSFNSTNIYKWFLTKSLSPPSNQAPTVDAGVDKLITHPTNSAILTGSASDTGGIASTLWTQISGPSIAILNGNTSTTLTASGLIEGAYVFRLTATDNLGAVASDDATVTVNPAPTNVAPIAQAGADKVITLPTNSTVLTGSGTDDGTITAYTWAKVSGPTATLFGEATSTLTLSNLLEGVYVFQLTVTDNQSATGIDDVTVTVLPDPIQIPIWINKLNVTDDAAGTLTKSNSAVLAGASSQQVLAAGTDGWVETQVDQSGKVRTIGLSDVDADASLSTIDYGIQFAANTNVFTVEQGVKIYSHNYVIGQVYRVERQDSTITYKKDGVTFRTSTIPSTTSLVVDTNLENIGARIYNLKILFGTGGGSSGGRLSSSTTTRTNTNASLEKVNSISAYPNPVSTTLFISLPEKAEGPLNVRITDASGRLEWEGLMSNDSNIITIDVASTKIASGLKTISIMKSNGEVVHKRVQKIE